MNFNKLFLAYASVFVFMSCQDNYQKSIEKITSAVLETHRPTFHFTPIKSWMNDPNGLVYDKGEYHLFYQYYPDSTVWGPMHWGHAVSKDMLYWQDLPIALYPDSIGYIFSGSVVVDKNNTSGLQKGVDAPLIAIYTYHHPLLEKQNSLHIQTQGLAYSNDKGRTWKKYVNNPVLKNGTYKDFRDPKVFWYAPEKKWVMSLAVGDRIQFYASKNLLEWTLTGEFGQDGQGSHKGVWECPDLIQMKSPDGKTKWVLLVSVGPGETYYGTQYFVGHFDGKNFYNDNPKKQVLWVDYGADNYAGVTWGNLPNDTILFLGWMSNWLYAQKVPTIKWRSAMTIPRMLTLAKTHQGLVLANNPITTFTTLRQKKDSLNDTDKAFNASQAGNEIDLEIDLAKSSAQDFGVCLSNTKNENLRIGFNKKTNQIYIDRSKAGKHNFYQQFASIHSAKRISNAPILKMRIILDVASAEVFCDEGTLTMTEIFFPNEDFKTYTLYAQKGNLALTKKTIYTLTPTIKR